mgnify:CR=1 FL=1
MAVPAGHCARAAAVSAGQRPLRAAVVAGRLAHSECPGGCIDVAAAGLCSLPTRLFGTPAQVRAPRRYWLIENRASFERQALAAAPGPCVVWLPGQPPQSWREAMQWLQHRPTTGHRDNSSPPWQARPPAHGNYLFSDRARAAYSAHSVRGPQPRASEKRSLREPGGHGPPRPRPADAGCTHHDRSPSAHPPGHGGVVGAADAGLHRGDAPCGRRRPDRSRASVLVDPGVRRGHHHGVRAHPQRRQPALCRPVAHAVPDRLCDCLQRGGLCDRRPRAALRHPFSRSS